MLLLKCCLEGGVGTEDMADSDFRFSVDAFLVSVFHIIHIFRSIMEDFIGIPSFFR